MIVFAEKSGKLGLLEVDESSSFEFWIQFDEDVKYRATYQDRLILNIPDRLDFLEDDYLSYIGEL